MAEKLMKDLEEDLICSICLNRFTLPKMLPCIHSFCKVCLEKHVSSLRGKEFECPICKKVCELPSGVKGLLTNFYLANIGDKIDLYEKVKPPEEVAKRCGICDNSPVTAFCENCDCVICSICKQNHSRGRAFCSHSVVPITNINSDTFQQSERYAPTPTCDLHSPEKLRFYCKTCSKMICRECTVVLHPKPTHQCVEAQTQFADAKHILTKLLKDSDIQKKLALQFIQEEKAETTAVANESTSIIKEITDKYERTKTAIDKQLKDQKEKACMKALTIKTAKESNIEMSVKQAIKWETRMHNTQDVTRKVLRESNSWELLAISNDLIGAFKALQIEGNDFEWPNLDLQLKVTFTPREIPTIAFGECFSEDDIPTIVYNSQLRKFILCSIDKEHLILELKVLNADNDGSFKIGHGGLFGQSQSSCFKDSSFVLKTKQVGNSKLTAIMSDNSANLIVGYGKFLIKFNSNRIANIQTISKDHDATISGFDISSTGNIFIVFENAPYTVHKYVEQPSLVWPLQVYAHDGLLDIENVSTPFQGSTEKINVPKPIKNIACIGRNQILITSTDKELIICRWGTEQFTSVNIPSPPGLNNPKKLDTYKGNLLRQTVTKIRKESMPACDHEEHFTCYVLWGEKPQVGSISTKRQSFVVTKYNSQTGRNEKTWKIPSDCGRPIACYHDNILLNQLLVCDGHGNVSSISL